MSYDKIFIIETLLYAFVPENLSSVHYGNIRQNFPLSVSGNVPTVDNVEHYIEVSRNVFSNQLSTHRKLLCTRFYFWFYITSWIDLIHKLRNIYNFPSLTIKGFPFQFYFLAPKNLKIISTNFYYVRSIVFEIFSFICLVRFLWCLLFPHYRIFCSKFHFQTFLNISLWFCISNCSFFSFIILFKINNRVRHFIFEISKYNDSDFCQSITL